MPYPIDNRRATLTVDFHYIRRQVGEYLEITMSQEEWDAEQNEVINDVIKDGLQLYYYPPLVENDQTVHEWTFMRPSVKLTTVADQRRYPLPDSFERLIGNITRGGTDSTSYFPISLTSASRLRALDALERTTGYPQYCAIEPADSTGDAPQTLILALHPTPDAAYVLELQYQAMGVMIDSDHPYPLGGQAHGPGILYACLAVAEFRKIGDQGPMHAKFMQTLAANVARDRQRGARIVGYNANNAGDGIISRGQLRRRNLINNEDVTYG